MNDIKGFFGEYRWLSNYHLCPIKWGRYTFPSTENIYQWLKIDVFALKDPEKDFNDLAALFTTCSPKEAKQWGKTVPLRPDWEKVKIARMLLVNSAKYMDHPELTQKLLDTGDVLLEETNTWNDTFWGVCNGVGENNLGKILMLLRSCARKTAWDPALMTTWFLNK